ncbi:unnamed protein product [Fusarium langsethiae]|nr:unnamed protein product [Fusarium langsethiae]
MSAAVADHDLITTRYVARRSGLSVQASIHFPTNLSFDKNSWNATSKVHSISLFASSPLQIPGIRNPGQTPSCVCSTQKSPPRDAEEVTFKDMEGPYIPNKKGYAKIRNCCSVARNAGFKYVWVDTCCIDKTSSAELSEAINSMYRWYQQAEVCYAYLADVPAGQKGHRLPPDCKWFTRGWTLQELIAPSEIIFLNQKWERIGTNSESNLQQEISNITHIPLGILSGDDNVETASIAQRMTWASKRNTSRLEDRAYCLLGIFDINMPLLYGEGVKAFVRLQEEIMKVSDDHSIFAWRADSKDKDGRTRLSYAAGGGDDEVVWLLLTRSDVEVHSRDNMGGTPLLRAAKKGHEMVINIILARGNVRNHLKDNHGRTPLSHASEGGHRAAVNVFRARSDMEPDTEDNKGRTPLSYAAEGGHKAVITMLLSRGGDIKSNYRLGQILLYWAAENGHEDVVTQLLDNDADVNAKSESGWTPLMGAAKNGHKDTIAQLLDKDVDINAKVTKYGQTLLSWAAEKGYEAIIRQLCEMGADINKKGQSDWTPLIWAAREGHQAVVELLLENGANPEAKSTSGLSPLSFAELRGHTAVASLLIKNGANIKSRANSSHTLSNSSRVWQPQPATLQHRFRSN